VGRLDRERKLNPLEAGTTSESNRIEASAQQETGRYVLTEARRTLAVGGAEAGGARGREGATGWA
jgi:hypothetical protein